MMQKISAYICLNDFYKEKLLDLQVPDSKIYVRPNSIDASEFVSTGTAPSGDYAVFLGRLSPEKGLWTLVKAFEKLAPARLKIVGTGPLEGDLSSYIRERKLDNIEMLGFRAGLEKTQLLQGALFSVIPSEWYENFPVVALESYAAAKPIVASRIGGLASIVADGETGLFFAAGNSDELADKLRYLFANPREAKRMGALASTLTRTKYSREASYRNLMEIFRNVMAA
jgi:glycosyltransferase involved in cell wall biosynthesis